MKTDSMQLSPNPRKRWRIPVIGLVVVGIAGGGWMMYSKNTAAQAQTPDKTAAKKEVIFELAPADVTQIQMREVAVNLPISGSLTPVSQATVRSKVAAEVLETLVQEGMPVRKGQVIARFDGADLRARLITQDALVDEARAKLSLAQKNRQSNETLLKQNYISQNAFDTMHNGVELAQANLKSAMSQREVAQIAVADTLIKSPVDGIVSKRSVQAGEKVSPDSALFTIVNLSQLILEAQVPSSEIPRISIGQSVNFNVDGFNGRNFSGKVARINPATEAGSRSMLVYIEVGNADGALKGGMFAKGNLTLQKNGAYPVIPLSAARQQNGKDVVYKVVKNQVQLQAVKLGLRNEDEGVVQVLEGLDAGANVISAKLDEIKPGSKVALPKLSAAAGAASSAAPASSTVPTKG
ncbi:efflux RND transporter periplasmic adaptor subunit [Undibacterium sp.]|jgi:membrane fusion protein (multidrug efflux system)|uniref:efflux RND transporter periplasmic adaptor subunit n=1 Tax=Undibacterium sp. TaxID=1914977 RepID=UPI002D7F5F88|nr:efflux RND transporter periplasmic adaptor subunit [Undibacterium sp.]